MNVEPSAEAPLLTRMLVQASPVPGAIRAAVTASVMTRMIVWRMREPPCVGGTGEDGTGREMVADGGSGPSARRSGACPPDPVQGQKLSTGRARAGVEVARKASRAAGNGSSARSKIPSE